MIKNLCNLSNEKTQHFFILNYRDVGEGMWAEVAERHLNKWNRGRLLLKIIKNIVKRVMLFWGHSLITIK